MFPKIYAFLVALGLLSATAIALPASENAVRAADKNIVERDQPWKQVKREVEVEERDEVWARDPANGGSS